MRENSWTKTRYLVETLEMDGDSFIALRIDTDSRIYTLARSNGIMRPKTGILFAEKLDLEHNSVRNLIFARKQPKKHETYLA